MKDTQSTPDKDQVNKLRDSILYELKYSLGVTLLTASSSDVFSALALVVRRNQVDDYFSTQERHYQARKKRIYYISMEFLIGQSLRNNLINQGMMEITKAALESLGVDFEIIVRSEEDAALGNGGLGRLAACFIDSMATLDLAGSGHGIKYEYGLFHQQIQDGKQIEKPDDWHSAHSPWLIEHQSQAMIIPLYGRIEEIKDLQGNYNPMWMDWKIIIGVPHDYLVSGYNNNTVNSLRLYSACASDSFDIHIFNHGDYLKAVNQKIASENISKVLYPSDEILAGKELRLTQEYFLVACTLRDVMHDFFLHSTDLNQLPEFVAIQLNDTHPALAIVELMRILVDEHAVDWDIAWDLTQRTCAYTNHTLMPEALEKWSVNLFELLLPRHLQIIYEINRRFLLEVHRWQPERTDLLASMSLIEEMPEKKVRMAYLAIIGSHKVNGVAKLHSDLIKSNLVPDFYHLMPEKFTNQTNGVTPRRWIQQANPRLSLFLDAHLGNEWVTNLTLLTKLRSLASDRDVIAELAEIKKFNKLKLSQIITRQQGITINPDAMFDCQIKRIHEYKRQLLNVLYVINLYHRILDGVVSIAPKVHIFSGKAAPGYAMAKLIIQLINQVALKVNNDPNVNGQLKVVFLEDYKVSLAESIIPAADLSEQISTAGTEASGTSNMKLAMNGALTIGTLDGANIEIRDAVGHENFYVFGLSAEQIAEQRSKGRSPYDEYASNTELKMTVDSLISGFFHADKNLFYPLFNMLVNHGDHYFHLADFSSYCQAQHQALTDYNNTYNWHSRALNTISGMGEFSSDRTIRGYSRDIWGEDSLK
ncbi:glycogen/starch/alpha-glucan phosphorylase [Yersinia aldovae]|uniref:Alpha-1,4 glucan phosphorylase n=1 Tax=Yersinia aldovae TaxID=29483 RepID=A0A0T9TDV7_YERAL|nr:glycogen/starch/alpha-glucan phosphorylase [Yersinia aldovae]AJJ61734.1 glycogen/starch/alpha-glucan phosphorylases family protein [Yersinia aldovae 670-83]EEP97211.1 Glycogen/starch/alpha-glucan phosphorylase [Yersinia aldovae ATCC 35236]CNJ36117.1 glycogen phosphorylase [Yersinia aldovae]CNK76727.1 glycogen phosphorylase [Yersinia aldovae]CNK96531.1 glycogen phosphorylase [Yersinia aldovae]